MLKENWRSISRVARVSDVCIVVLAFYLAYHVRQALGAVSEQHFLHSIVGTVVFSGADLAPFSEYALLLVVGVLSYSTVLTLLGSYRSIRLSSPAEVVVKPFIASSLVFVVLGFTLFILKLDISRSLVALFCLLSSFLIAIERCAVLGILRFWRRRGLNFRNVIICGLDDQAIRLATQIAGQPELGIRIRCFADLRSPLLQNPDEQEVFKARLRSTGTTVVGNLLKTPEAVSQALKDYAIDEVIFCDLLRSVENAEQVILACSDQGIRTTIAADLFSLGMVQSAISHFGDIPLIHFQAPPGDRWELSIKRLLDLCGSAVLLTLLSPVFVAVAVAIRMQSPGPIFFRQKRVGLNGRLFTMLKFRSMVQGAEALRAELAANNEMEGPVFKLSNDPRVTTVGRFLRKHSLDELPQLWNVFRGEMSLVGPRPPLPHEVNLYDRKDRRRLSMRPGLTCSWQVSGRNTIKDFETWVKLDLEYIDNWSLSRDLLLLLRTIPAVLFGRGAA